MKPLEILFPIPNQCAFCDRSATNHGICKLCYQEIEPIHGPICERCGRAMKAATICVDCYQREDTYFLANRSAVHYNGKMKAIISQYKFRGHETLSCALTTFLEEAFRGYFAHIPFDCITFVPLHESRLRERGFNQAQLLAIQLGLRLKLPVKPLLTRTRPTEKQSQKDRRARLQFFDEAVQLLPLQSPPPARVLLIDDIYTTGTTINACAKALAKEGIVVYSLTVAR